VSTVFPRILLLSWQRPDGRYAGAEVLRKILGCWPHELARWAYLDTEARTVPAHLPPSRAFPPRPVHWRLRNTVWRYWYMQHWQSRRLALAVAEWARAFQPQVLWVLAELGTVTVGERLARLLQTPVHVTLHDALEFGRFALPRSYYPLYIRAAHRLLRRAATFDAISPALREHAAAAYAVGEKPAMIFPPSIARVATDGAPSARPWGDAMVRKIALCGSMRISSTEWRRFLGLMGRLPYTIELLAYVDRATFFQETMPPNVGVRFEPYLSSETELVAAFRAAAVDAAYLGLTRLPEQSCFARYSLSSKLTAYTAAALPVIVDAPEDSWVWRLVSAYQAGILCGEEEDVAVQRLKELLSDKQYHLRLAQGAQRLCREELDLERNVEQFRQLLWQAVGKHT